MGFKGFHGSKAQAHQDLITVGRYWASETSNQKEGGQIKPVCNCPNFQFLSPAGPEIHNFA